MSDEYYLGIDIGGTKLRIGLVNSSFNIEDIIITKDHRRLSPEKLVSLIGKLVEKNYKNLNILGAGIGFPGPVNIQKGSPFSYSNLFNDEWGNTPLAAMIENTLKVPSFLENDANLAGLAEMRLGAGRNYSNVIYLTISTGIGGAIFINNQIYRGFLGNAGELGHMVINIQGQECKCGNTGCFMAEVSGLALEKLLRNNPDLCLALEIPEDLSKGVKKLLQLAVAGNKTALTVIKPLQKCVSVSLYNFVQILNPELIIIGGGIGKTFMDLFLPEVARYFDKYLPQELVTKTLIKEAELSDTNGIIGGAILVKEELNK